MNALQWSPADDRQIASAPCRRKQPFDDQEIEQGLESLIPDGDRKISRNVFGIQLENESETLVNLLEALLRFQGPLGREMLEPEEARKNQKAFSSACRTVRCVVEDPAIFGPRVGPRLLFMLGRYGFNGSPHSVPNSSQWKQSELDDVLMALSDFPPSLLPVIQGRQLTHFSRGFVPGYISSPEKVLANAFIFVLDNWDRETRESRQEVIFHEVGHVIGSHYDLDGSAEWLKFSDWSTRTTIRDGIETKDTVLGNPGATVSLYAQTNPVEEFAETVVAYRYNPDLLLKRSPEKYRFMKEAVFDGLEYTSEESCAPEKSLSQSLGTNVSQKAKSLSADGPALRKLASATVRRCGNAIFQSFGEGTTLSAADLAPANACLDRALAIELASTLPETGAFRYPERTRNPALDHLRSAGAGPEVMNAFREAVIFKIRDTLADLMSALSQNHKYDYLNQPHQKLPASRFCDDYSKYAYQASEVIDKSFSRKDGDLSFAFNHREFLNRFAREICLSLHRGQSVITQPSDAAIRSEVAKKFRIQTPRSKP